MAQGGAGEAARTTAIVLFTDLVDSTALRSRIGETAAEKLRRRHDALVAAAVEAGRGTVVKNLGDGLMATFAGASDAVGAAVAIQQAIARLSRSNVEPVEVRIGMSAGDVVFEGDDCFGSPVIEAARLCGAADGGQILASELVRGLAHASQWTFTPVGSLELKGIPTTVPTVDIAWEPLPQSSVPLLLDAGGAAPADARRVDLLLGRGEAQRRAGDPGYRDTLLNAAELAHRLGDVRSLARAALANTQGHIWTAAFSVDAERIRTLEEAIAAVGQDDPPIRARLLATLGLELAWEPDPSRRLALSGEALVIARSIGDPDTLAHVLLARDYTITGPDNAAERFAATIELIDIAERTGDPVAESRALSLRFKAAMELADVAEAERSLTRNRVLVADLGQPILTWATLHHQATLRLFHGEGDAAAAIEAAAEFGQTVGQQPVLAMTHRASLALQQDRLAEMIDWWRGAAERIPSPMVQAVAAHFRHEVGDTEAAGGVFDRLAETGFAHPPNNAAWLVFFTECAWLCARLGRVEAVPRLRSALEPYADQLVISAFAAWAGGPVALFLGMLATTVHDWSDAEARFAEAAATQERVGAPAWLARTRLEWARMLLARAEPGDERRARELLEQAVIAAAPLGFVRIEREARGILSAS